MVFESIVTDLLNRYLGDYIENLDTKQLNIGIWGGDVVLQNLRLRQDALRELELPVTTVYGRLGKLVLKIPWKNLYSMPVIVDIEDLYLLVAPNAVVGYDAVKTEAAAQAYKQAELEAADEVRKREKDKDIPVADKTFTEKMVAQIINNVQITIRNVHIRYEDRSTSVIPFALGITLGSLEVHTTNSNWQKTFLSEILSKVFKVAKLDGLALYMNCSIDMFEFHAAAEYNKLFLETIAYQNYRPEGYQYVLGPITALARLKLTMNPELERPAFVTPKIELDLDMEKLAVGLTRAQYQRLIELADGFAAMNRGYPYRKYRPFNTPVIGNARTWWRFATTCVLEDIKEYRRQFAWASIKEHCKMCRDYRDDYQTKLVSRKCPADVKSRLAVFEERLDLFNLQLIRQRVFVMVEAAGEMEKVKEEPKGWFSGWWGGSKDETSSGADVVNKFRSAMTPAEKAKLFNAIGFDENEVITDMPTDYSAVIANFQLKMLEVRINNNSLLTNDPLAEVNVLTFMMEDVSCALDQRPASSGLSVDLRMRELTATGQKQGDRLPVLVKSQIRDMENQLEVFFEMNPVDKSCDQRVKVNTRQLQIVYDAETIIQLMDVFKTPSNTNLSEFTDAAAGKLANIKERSATGMQFMVDQKTRLEVTVTIMPNYVIIPYGGVYIEDESPVLVIGLGLITLKTAPFSERMDVASMYQSGLAAEEIMEAMLEQAYDRFTLDVKMVQVLIAKPGEKWFECLVDDRVTKMHILEPTALYAAAEICQFDDDPRLPKTKLSVKIPSVVLTVADTKVLDALDIGLSIPLPVDNSLEPKPLGRDKGSGVVSSSMSIKRFLDDNQFLKKRNKKDVVEVKQDVTQFTDLEFGFVLHELSINIYREGTDSGQASSSYGTPSEDYHSVLSGPQAISAAPSPQGAESSANSDDQPDVRRNTLGTKKYIEIKINQLEMGVIQRTYDLKVSLKLGAVSFQQFRMDDMLTVPQPMIETPTFANKTGYLFSLYYTSVNKSSPEFTTKHKSVEQRIDIDFTVFILRLHQERLVELLHLVNDFQLKYDCVAAKQAAATANDGKDRVADAGAAVGGGAVHAIGAVLATIAEEGASPELPVKAPKKNRPQVVESVKLQVMAKIGEVVVVLDSDRRLIAELKIEKLRAGVVMKSSYTDVCVHLRDIVVTDLKKNTIHPTIMSIVGSNAINCKLVMYNVDQTTAYNQDDMSLDVSMGCARIIFLNWFVTSVLAFLENFQAAQQALADAGAAAAETAKLNMVSAYENEQRIRLKVHIQAPIILVPIASDSREAIAIDLGNLAIRNVISDVTSATQTDRKAIVDDIEVMLKDMKLTKVFIEKCESKRPGRDLALAGGQEIDETEDSIGDSPLNTTQQNARLAGITTLGTVLHPTTFALFVKRNLSAAWYKTLPEMDVSGRLKSIVVNLTPDDYRLMMAILSQNLVEGADEKPPPRVVEPPKPKNVAVSLRETSNSDAISIKTVTAVHVHGDTSKGDHPVGSERDVERWASAANDLAAVRTIGTQKPVTANKQIVDTFLKFSFQMDSIVLSLSKENDIGLATFGIHFLSLKGLKLVDGSMSASIVLCDVQMDDARPNRQNYITRYMKKKETPNAPPPALKQLLMTSVDEDIAKAEAALTEPVSSMVDIVARMTDAEMFLQLKVSSFDLILSLDFIMQLLKFLHVPDEAAGGAVGGAATPATAVATGTAPVSAATASGTQPEKPVVAESGQRTTIIIHIEQPDIILVEQMDDINCLALFFNTEIKLRVRMFDSRQTICGEIGDLKLFVCEFNPERRGLTNHYVLHPCNISLNATTPDAKGMNVSLTTSDIRLNISPVTIDLLNKAVTTFTQVQQESETKAPPRPNYSDIWDVKPFVKTRYWFLQPTPIENALEADEMVDGLPELCVVDIPSLVVVVETGFGYYTFPMLILRSEMNAEVRNWSSQMGIKSRLSLGMSYYNSSLAVWEPIIEPNERENVTGLTETVPWELSFSLQIDNSIDDPTTEEVETKTLIAVSSSDTLELTVTKTCLDVLQDLSKSFSEALSVEGLKQPDVVAPYVLINDTGFDVTLLLENGQLRLHSKQPTGSAVQQGADSTEVVSCIVAPGDRAYLDAPGQKASSSWENCAETDMFLSVKVGNIDKELQLPVHRSDRRYFPLYRDTKQEPWAIISNVQTEYGSKIITLQGVLTIENHFSTSVHVFRRNETGYQTVGTVQAGATFNVPLHALYANNKELYFSIDGYETSVHGIAWNTTPNDLEYTKVLQCDPQHTFEPFHIKVIRERLEVFHEVTSRVTMLSACYVFHLRPPIYVRNALPINIHVSVSGSSALVDEGEEIGEDGAIAPQPIVVDPSRISQSQQEDFLDVGEKVVGPGDILHLPTVRTAVKQGATKSFIIVRLVNYLEKDWSCSTQIPDDPPEVAVWTFNSYDSVSKMSMQLGVKFENTKGSIQLIVYCPYWMINKTGLMLSYRPAEESVNVLYHPPDLDGPILFSFREKAFFGKKKATVRVETGEWSDKFALDAAGSTGVVQCSFDSCVHEIAVHNTLTSNSLTKQLVFMPMYVMINNATFPIEVQEDQRPGDPWLRVDPDQCVPLWPKAKYERMLRIRTVDEPNASVPFEYNEVQTSLLRIKNRYGGINVDVQRTEGGVFITFTEYYPGDAPAKVVNHTDKEIVFFEKGNVNAKIVKSQHEMLYTWADPAGQRVIYFEDNGKHIENDLRRDGLNKFKPTADSALDVFWVSFLDGTQRVLLFTNDIAIAGEANSANRIDKITQEIEVDIHGIGFSLVNNSKQLDIMYIGLASSGIIWEEKRKLRTFKALKIAEVHDLEERYQDYHRQKSVGTDTGNQFGLNDGSRVEIAADGKMVWQRPKTAIEVRRTFYPGLWMLIKTSPYQMQFHAKINRIQIDNQLVDCIFPVVLAPVPPPKSVAASTELKPFIECSVVQRIVPHSAVTQYKYMKVLIQEFHVKVDLLFINAIVDMVSAEITDEQALALFNADIAAQKAPLSSFAVTRSANEQKNFYDQLHMGPLKIHISFSMAGLDPGALPGVLSTILTGVGVTLTDINDIVFRLAFFERGFMFFTHPQLQTEIISHYTNQAVKQAYVLILGLDVIGNPYGLVVGLTKGVEDLFYEPFQGLIQGPGEFAEGLALGVRSLFGHTVGGAAGAVSKITGAMGKGLAVLTFDDDYQMKRRKQLTKKPVNLQEGLARSGRGLVMGVFDGVTGVVTKPISGAQAEGVGGFFKGLGKGAVGLVARPTAGIADFASGSLDAVRRATDMTVEVVRLRPRRFLHSDGVVRPFSLHQAEGNRLLKEVDKGKYGNSDTFVDYHSVIAKREALVLTDHRLLYCSRNDLFGQWQVDWTYRWAEVSHVRPVERGIEMMFGQSTKKVLGLFSSREPPKKVILMPKNAKQLHLIRTMQQLREAMHS